MLRLSHRVAVWLGFAAALWSCSARASLTNSAGSNLVLADSERVYIAKIEHQGLTLNQKGFPLITAGIREHSLGKLTNLFAPDFKGEGLDPDNGSGPENEMLRIRRSILAADGPAVRPSLADANGFARYLIGLRDRFGTNAKVELALMSLSPLDREKLDGAWKGNCAFRIVGLRSDGSKGELMAKIEFEFGHIAEPDAIQTDSGWIRALRIAEIQEGIAKSELMAEVGKEWGIDRNLFQDNWTMLPARRTVITGGVYLADVDDDGYQDMLVTDVKGMRIFRGGPGGHFEDVTTRCGLPANLRGVLNVAFGDFDNDGLVDLLIHTRAFRNVGNFRFQEVHTEFQFEGISGFTVGDYDRDGKLDIYVSRNDGKGQHTGRNSWVDGPGGPGNQLWRNLGNWKFEEVSQKANAQAGRRSCFTAAWLDANNDNWPDIYVINEFGGGVLLINQGDGTFKEMALLDDPGDFGSMGMCVGDYNNDGNIDVYTANMYSKAGRRIFENLSPGTYPPEIWAKIKRFVTGSELYRNAGNLKFERVGKNARVHAVGWAYGATFTDLDNDGFLDLYATAGFMSVNKEEPDG